MARGGGKVCRVRTRAVGCGLAWGVLACPGPAWARKTNQAVYQEPFDVAAGGASLTRGSQEGILFSNPAVLPFTDGFHRWFGTQVSVFANREAPALIKASQKKSDEGSGDGPGPLVDKLFEAPLHVGAQTATSYITKGFGIGAFGSLAQDLEAREHGPAGVPAVELEGEGYGGAVLSGAWRLGRPFALGVTAKYLYVTEPYVTVDLSDTTRIQEMAQDTGGLKQQYALHKGVGADVGMLYFAQGSFVDFRWALKADDVGGTRFDTGGEPFKQTLATGMAVTFHGAVESLHLALDYRDVLGAYGEKPFKKVYAGAKLVIRNFVGFAAGYYQGIPSAGLRLDLFVAHVGVTAYGREMGSYPGEKQRNLYVGYFGVGL